MLSHLVLGAGLLTEAIRLFYHFGGLCAASSLTTLTMDHTSSSKEETSGLKVSSGSKTGPDWMCLDKRNRGGICPLEQYSIAGCPADSPKETQLLNWPAGTGRVLIPLPSLSPSYFLSPIWFCSLFPDGNLCRNVFSSLLYSDQTYTIPSFVPSCFTVYKAPFSASTQSLSTLDRRVMSHLLISVQLCAIFHSRNVAPLKKTKKENRNEHVNKLALSSHQNAISPIFHLPKPKSMYILCVTF